MTRSSQELLAFSKRAGRARHAKSTKTREKAPKNKKMKLNGCHNRNDGPPPVMEHILNACHIRTSSEWRKTKETKRKENK